MDGSALPHHRAATPRLRDEDSVGDVLGYARVSTGDQDFAGQTMRLQEAGAIKVFTDVRSGKSLDRPGLTELLAYARKGDTLAVVRLDRLGRSLAELISIVEQLKARDIALLSLEEKIDTSSAAGELIFHVFGAIAHFERRLIAELADGTNLGLARMAEASRGVTRDQLVWTADAYIRSETYQAALVRIIDAHHRLPVAALWGAGTTSSSDGQFFRSGKRGNVAGEI